MPVVGSSAYSNAGVLLTLVRSLLNDYGLSPAINITAISRAAAVVTVTTATPHGLLPGGTVTIIGVADTSFNGAFTVASVASSVSFSYNQGTGADGSSTGGTAAATGAVFRDQVLLPYINSAYRKVQRGLAMSGSTRFQTDEVILIVAAVTAVDQTVQVAINEATPAPNQLPPDLIEPLKIWERRSGSTNNFEPMTDVTETGGLPSVPQTQTLRWWEWRDDQIFFIGALQDTQIRLRYQKVLSDLTDATSTVLIRNSQDAIGYLGAALAVQARNPAAAQSWDTIGMDALENLISAAVRQQQRTPRRRMAFSRRMGKGSIWM